MGSLYERDGKWGIDYRDHRNRRVRKVVAADKSVAQQVLGTALAAVEKLRNGVATADPREAKRPFTEQTEAYLSELKRRGRDEMYRYIVTKRLEAAAASRNWECLRDCTARSVSAYLRELADGGKSP